MDSSRLPAATCAGIEAGPAFTVETGGDATFTAGTRIALSDGFSVQSGASFTAGVDSGAGTVVQAETYTYQDYQYFLTQATGPWGAFAWTHDQIGNRLTETHDAVTDTYVYQPNAAAGNTALLTQITLGAGGTRDYQFGTAGHLELVTAGANEVDFVNDEEGRLGQLARPVASETADLLYDGRSYLQSATDPGTGATTRPTYSSEGLLHALTRQEGPAEPETQVLYLHFAGRPVAQLTLDGLGGQALLFLTTDHLGTPEVAVDAAGTTVWDSAFEPFGRDAEEATTQGATENGIYLRFPGQWDDGRWEGAALGAGVYYNLRRWYQPGIDRYTRTDPLGRGGDIHPYVYAASNPLSFLDPQGEKSRVCCTPITEGGPLAAFKHCFIETQGETTETSTTHAVHRVRGKGCKYENDGFDQGRVGDARTECGPWEEECGTDECVAEEFSDYPNPSDYQLIRGPNSNSFARTVTDACGLTAPSVAGTKKTPGWGKEGRPAKNKRFQCPEVRLP